MTDDRHPETIANDPAIHPNYWAPTHPEGCPTCQVCPDCFRPRRPDQYPATAATCNRCSV